MTIAFKIVHLPDLSTVASSLPLLYDERFEVVVSETGSGKGKLPLDDATLDDITIGFDVVQAKPDGTNVRGAFLVEQMDDHTLDEAGPGACYTQLSGRGVSAVMEWACIEPANGVNAMPVETERLFSWQSPQFDDSSWDAAVLSPAISKPKSWPSWLYDRGLSIFGPSTTMVPAESPNGATFLRKTFTVASDTEFMIHATADNWGKIWIDGQMILQLGEYQTAAWRDTYTLRGKITAGEHTAAARVYNKGSDNAGGLRFLMSDADHWEDALVESDTSWVALESATSGNPGPTVGEAVRWALEEAQDRGCLEFVTPSFTDTHDTEGTAWSDGHEFSTSTGNNMLTWLEELAATDVDWRVHPGTFELDMWVKGNQGDSRSISWVVDDDPDVCTIVTLDRQRT